MRTFFALVFATALSMTINAQDKFKDIFPLINGKITYTNIVKVDSISKDEIYNRAKHWLAYNYDYFKIDDKDELICKGHIQYGYAQIWQIITIKIKEGRYKYEITNFQATQHVVMEGSSSDIDVPLEKYQAFLHLGEKEAYKNIDSQINAQIESLKKAISTEKTENW